MSLLIEKTSLHINKEYYLKNSFHMDNLVKVSQNTTILIHCQNFNHFNKSV